MTQWVPARTATPERSIIVATSWGCAPFISNEMIAPWSRAAPKIRSELISRMGGDRILRRPNAGLADRVDVVDRRSEADRLDDRRRARLELVRRIAVGDRVLVHFADHLAAAVERPHGRKMSIAAVQRA